MKLVGALILIATILSGISNGLIFLSTVVELLRQWVGSFGYVLWIFVAPIFSPAAIILPWFVAWVEDGPVREGVVWLWASFYVCLLLRALFWKWAPDR